MFVSVTLPCEGGDAACVALITELNRTLNLSRAPFQSCVPKFNW